MTTPTTDRSELDRLHAAADLALRERNAIDDCFSPEWRAAHVRAGEAFAAEIAERIRLWKLDRWGTWMRPIDREIATITGEIN